MPEIYFIISIKNLTSVLKEGALLCQTTVETRGLERASIAHSNIKARRATTRVPVPPYGMLADYVPFYFAPRSPMLFVINKGGVEGYTEKQGSIVYLVSSTEAVVEHGLKYAFTDGHGTMAITKFYQDVNDLDKIDWRIMKERIWRDSDEDPDRKRRRQAEFLVFQCFPFEYVSRLAVYDTTMQLMVQALLQESPYRQDVQLQPAWYYD